MRGPWDHPRGRSGLTLILERVLDYVLDIWFEQEVRDDCTVRLA